jgi:hypothetical protein
MCIRDRSDAAAVEPWSWMMWKQKKAELNACPCLLYFLVIGRNQAFFFLRVAANPARPAPKRSMVAGSGVGAVSDVKLMPMYGKLDTAICPSCDIVG